MVLIRYLIPYLTAYFHFSYLILVLKYPNNVSNNRWIEECHKGPGWNLTYFNHYNDATWAEAKPVNLTAVLPGYDPDYDTEWDGWEAREVVFKCSSVTEPNHGPMNYTAVLVLDMGLALCGSTLIFVSESRQVGHQQSLQQFISVGAGQVCLPLRRLAARKPITWRDIDIYR